MFTDPADTIMFFLVGACAVPGLLGTIILMTEPEGKALALGEGLLRFMFGSVVVVITPLYFVYSTVANWQTDPAVGTTTKLVLALTIFVSAYHVFTHPPKKEGAQ